jgi:hypothetical protein
LANQISARWGQKSDLEAHFLKTAKLRKQNFKKKNNGSKI